MWRSQLFLHLSPLCLQIPFQGRKSTFFTSFPPLRESPCGHISEAVMKNNESLRVSLSSRKSSAASEAGSIQYYILKQISSGAFFPGPMRVRQSLPSPAPGSRMYLSYARWCAPGNTFSALLCIKNRFMRIFMRMDMEYFSCILAYSPIF